MKRQMKILALLLAMLLTLAACGDDEEAPESEAVEQYVLGENVLEKVLTTDSIPTVTQGENRICYTYTISAPGAHARIYHDKLVDDLGFSVLDSEGYVIKKVPDYTTQEGQARYAKAAQEAGMKLELTVTWKEEEKSCAMELTLLVGGVDEPPGEGMTAAEAMEYFSTLNPAELGLEGESMSEYRIYNAGGSVFVNGVPCMKIQVYDADNPEQTNHLAGTYFLNGDGRRIYRLNDDETVSVVK